MITEDLQLKTIDALKTKRATWGGSDAKLATSLDINPTAMSRLLKGDKDRVLSVGKWISLARAMDVHIGNNTPWKIAITPVFEVVTAILKKCQDMAISAIICDQADIGKTVAARDYVRKNKHAVYIDGSLNKTKQKLIRAIAKEFGVNHTGRYNDVLADLIWYLKSIPTPMVVVDEAGDLNYEAFLELKALWNGLEGCCGWAMIGADGLEAKINRAIDNKKVGYTEIFRRYGKKYQRCTPQGKEEAQDFFINQAVRIIKANAPEGVNIQKVLANTNGSLTRIAIELDKAKNK